MKYLILLASLEGILCCFPTNQRQFQHGAPNVQFEEPPAAPQASQALPGARVAAAGKSPNQPIVDSKSSSLQSLLGERVSLSEFSADGYNAEGGGPVNSGNALTCNFDDRPCCWANVPPPDDQLDWQVATGAPDKTIFPTSPDPEGSYLVAYARAAAPSDEAQFASCSIGCSASDITIRAKHWTSENVLLQVCLRESFPNAGVIHNPLLNCQEFPAANGLTVSELVLPKTSLVDVVFVASNFIGEKGDMAILDDIEVSYDRNGPECDATTEQEIRGTTQPQTVEMGNQKTAVLEEKSSSTMKVNGIKLPEEVKMEELEELRRREKFEKMQGGESHARSAVERFGEEGFRGGELAFGANRQKATSSINKEVEETVIKSTKTMKTHGQHVAKGAKTKKFNENICIATKCDFEDGSTCNYKDAHQTQSIRGLTTKFQVVSGQFMNRITGVKESIEGDFYAATFLFPREMAGLEATTKPFTEKTRLRFQYYEGTHGVQLKGCCGSIENCPFSSDKFVSVSDRVWKTASFRCPKGTEKVIFLCENTRTNQGACAVDDLGMVESQGHLQTVRPLC